MKRLIIRSLLAILCGVAAAGEGPVQTPPQIWADYDPDRGDFRQEIIKEETRDGKYYRESYISAYVLGEEIRIYCLYKVKAGAQKAPGLLNVHGWMGAASIDESSVNDGWAVMSYDYCGRNGSRAHFTRYPEKMLYGEMTGGKVTCSAFPGGKPITDARQTSDYLWYAMERRVLSHLIQQKEVDASRIGAKGYSYGGTLMWNLAMDPRVKAVVAYFGIGYTEYYRNRQVWMYSNPSVEPAKTTGEAIYLAGIAPEAHVPFITAATLFLNGSNDHHGGHERGLESFKHFPKGVPWDFAIQARGHHNTEKLGPDAKLWLDKHVLHQDIFWPGRPTSAIRLDAAGVPELVVTPASPERVTKVEMFYALKNPVSFTRAWRDAPAVRTGGTWTAGMPVLNVDDYVFGFANITYDTTAVVSSDFNAAIPAKLGNATATDKPSAVIYSGDGGLGSWTNVAEVEGVGGIKGFRCTDNRAGLGTEQMSDPKWKAPANGQLGFKFYCTQPQTLIFAADDYEGVIEITASDLWQEMVVDKARLFSRHNPKQAMPGWDKLGRIAIKPKGDADITKVLFAEFKWVVK